MQRLLIATLLLSFAGCSEEPAPPKPKKAPEPGLLVKEKKQLPTPPPPPPPPPAPVEDKTKAPKEIPKMMLDPGLPEWNQTAPATYKVKFSTSKGDFTVQVTRE